MPINYDESYNIFISYIKEEKGKLKDKLKILDENLRYRSYYGELKSRDYNKFIKLYDKVCNLSDNIKNNLDIIKFLCDNDLTNVPQMNSAIDSILNDEVFKSRISNLDSKEMIESKINDYDSIISGNYDFEVFKNVLLNSNLDDRVVLDLLSAEAFKSTQVTMKEEQELDELSDRDKELIEEHKKIIDEVSELINEYYYLVESKPSNLIEMYKKAMHNGFTYGIENDVMLCLHILNLIELRSDGEEVLAKKPIDGELLEVNNQELKEVYNLAKDVKEKFEEEQKGKMPIDSNVYFLLVDGKPLFDVSSLSDDDKEKLSILIESLESGNYKSPVSVKKEVRKDLNVYALHRENRSVSYIKINSDGIRNNATLILDFNSKQNIFKNVSTILKNGELSRLVDESIKCIKEKNSEYVDFEQEFRKQLDSEISKGDSLK